MGLEIVKEKKAISLYSKKPNFITLCTSYEDELGWVSLPIELNKKEVLEVIKFLQKNIE